MDDFLRNIERCALAIAGVIAIGCGVVLEIAKLSKRLKSMSVKRRKK